MSFRTVMISSPAKLSFKDNYLYIRGETNSMIHLSEIHTLMIESTMVQITARLLNELLNFKIRLIICDEKHNPSAEMVPYNASFNTTKKIITQIGWSDNKKQTLWTHIIANKIRNQAQMLKKYDCKYWDKLLGYVEELELDDLTNREGHAAKVYFNSLFSKDFSRDGTSAETKALDYGYTVLLSAFNRSVTNLGYINQLGVKHKNEYNAFNLACDLIEPFRVLVDEVVVNNRGRLLDTEYKKEFVNLLNKEINYAGKNTYLMNAIPVYVGRCLKFLENEDFAEYVPYEFGV